MTIRSTDIQSYPRDDLPKIDHYPGGQTLPTPKAIDPSLAHCSAACRGWD
jgi:formate dehydrogenase